MLSASLAALDGLDSIIFYQLNAHGYLCVHSTYVSVSLLGSLPYSILTIISTSRVRFPVLVGSPSIER